MSSFTVRVELHEPVNPADYETLHAAMTKAGFARTIKREGEPSYHLPQAEYNEVGEFTADQVLERAKAAAATTRCKFSVLVTKSEESRKWYNLKPVK